MSEKNIPIPVFLNGLNQAVVQLLGAAHADEVYKRACLVDESGAEKPNQVGFSSTLEDLGLAMAERYDHPIAMGLLIRAGRAAFNFFRRSVPSISDLGSIENRLKPIAPRFSESMERLAAAFTLPQDMRVEIHTIDPLQLQWRMSDLSTAGKTRTFSPYFFFGLLQEFCQWLDARKEYQLVYNTVAEEAEYDDITVTIHDPQ